MRKNQKIKLLLLGILNFTCLISLILPAIAAKKPNPNEFPPNPLEITEPDPLLPRSPTKDRPLTPAEKTELAVALDTLNAEAAAKLAAGDRIGAFETWYRELRLRRYLGLLPEVQALSRVGAIAWGSRQREDVQIITKRLKTIQQEAQAKPPVELELLRSLGTAYEQVRDPKAAVEIYDQILAVARQQQDTAAEEATLITIGNLSLDWFDYPKAAATYRELLRMAQNRSDRLLQVTYLKQLAYIYDQSKQHQTAIQTKQQLIELFLNEQDFVQIPAIQLSIGANYEALGLVEQAAQNYQEAYAFSYQREMFTSAGEALQKLAELFQSTNQIDKALEVYQIIVTVDEQAFNIYGVMNAYDQIGRIYLSKKEYQKAIEAFQQGLAIAKQLQYRESYFAQQIEQASGSRNR